MLVIGTNLIRSLPRGAPPGYTDVDTQPPVVQWLIQSTGTGGLER
jgi:hypothetical protein